MSTAPAPQPTLAPGVSKWFNYFNVVALNAAATVAQMQADLSKGEHLQAVNDAVSGAANTVTQLFPAEAPLVQLGMSGFALGEMLIESIVGLFHHPSAPAPLAPAAIHNTLDAAAPVPAVTNPNL